MVSQKLALMPLLIFVLPAFIAGLILLKRGLKPPRKGTSPHCPGCEYNLTGLTSERCPECGWEVDPAAIVIGIRRKRPGLALIGLFLMLPLPLVGIKVVQEINWYRLKPDGWVIDDFQSGNVAKERRASIELDSRCRRGSLSDSAASRLAGICLAEQAKPNQGPRLGEMIELLCKLHVAGLLSQQQETTFFSQCVRLELQVRPRVVLGEKIPVRVKKQSSGPMGLWISMKGEREIILDGQPSGEQMSFSMGCRGLGARGGMGMSFSRVVPVGKHTIKLSVPVAIYPGSDEKPADLLYQAEVPLEAEFEIIEIDRLADIELIRDPALAKKMQAAITVTSLQQEGSRHRLKLAVTNLPANAAFDIIARVDDQERDLGDLSMKKGTQMNYSIGIHGEVPDGPFDLILRSNPDVARKTIDLFKIWDGELVYPDVQVTK